MCTKFSKLVDHTHEASDFTVILVGWSISLTAAVLAGSGEMPALLMTCQFVSPKLTFVSRMIPAFCIGTSAANNLLSCSAFAEPNTNTVRHPLYT